MNTYRIIQSTHQPGNVLWWCLFRGETELSRHATKVQAEAAKALRERQDAERRAAHD
jgi:hypothetical protein